MKRLLLIIDPQNDFILPSGSLYVTGALKDVGNIINLIRNYSFEKIIVSLDSHYLDDIGHPNFWISKDSKHPEPFAQISLNDFIEGKWKPIEKELNEKVFYYLSELEKKNKTHTIWSPHCIINTEGHKIFNQLEVELEKWSKTHPNALTMKMKGMLRYSESFGMFGPVVEFPSESFGTFDTQLRNLILEFDEIYITGEAKSHCVGESIEQLIGDDLSISKKLIILEDCMSNVPTFEHEIFKKIRENGAAFTKSTSLSL
jgi:nicotinamidase-related amidase